MQNIPRFVESKNGRQAITYPDKSLEGVLKETYGVIVYQEQVMEVARIIAGYSMGNADILRRAMGKKKKEILDKEKIPFIDGAVKQGYSREKAGAIFDMLVPFAGYGFNKSHAAAYSVLAYQTAYLKANFPEEFMAANLTNEIHSAKKNRLSECIAETRRMGIKVDPPSVNHSDRVFTVVDGRIVYGFLGIKGLGEVSAAEIVRGRSDGLYKSFMDFLDRVDIKAVGKKTIELLVKTGAFDSFGITRETLEGNLERAVEYAIKKKEDKIHGQTSLFEDSGETEYIDFEFEIFPEMTSADRLNQEKQLIGFYFSGHPMDEYKEIWQRAVKVDLGNIENLEIGSCILVGLIKNIKIINTGKGEKMAFAVLSDYNGEIDVTFFGKIWERYQNVIEPDKVVILQGKIDYQKNKDKYTFIADNIVNRNDIDAAVKESEDLSRKFDGYKNTWNYMATLKSGSLAGAEKGNYTIIGFLKLLRELKDRNGNDMAFGSLQDFEGDIDLVFFSRVYNECKNLLNIDEFIALKGSIDPENDRNSGKLSFRVSSIADIAQISRSAVKKAAAGEKPQGKQKKLNDSIKALPIQFSNMHIRLEPEAVDHVENLYPLRDYLAENSGNFSMFIYIPVSDKEKTIRAVTGITSLDDNILEDLRKIKFVAEVWRN
jgi:DNA polymerase-3 subunit alpha